MNQDGQNECLVTGPSGVELITKQSNNTASTILWQNPPDWHIQQAAITDLNHDGILEAALLVWRPFRPLPIDSYLPVQHSHTEFQTAEGQSCQMILLGWNKGEFKEIWAGSALAEPLQAFAAVDLDGDGFEELVTLDGRYENIKQPAQTLSVWTWNGFGFSLLAQEAGSYQTLSVVNTSHGSAIVAGN